MFPRFVNSIDSRFSLGGCGEFQAVSLDSITAMGPVPGGRNLLMDGAYEGDETRALAESLGYNVVVPLGEKPPRTVGV